MATAPATIRETTDTVKDHTARNGSTLLAIATCLCSGCAHELTVQMQPPVHYVSQAGDCFEARYGALSDGSLCFAKVRMPDGQEYTLPQVLSASGVRYTDQRMVVWWEHQGTIRVDVRDADGRWHEDAYAGLRAIAPTAEVRRDWEVNRWAGAPVPDEARSQGLSPKIQVDLCSLDRNGLRGPADGKVAVSYEFTIPATDACKAEVRAIDRTVQCITGAPGRIQAQQPECLCIGSTHQDGYREVLKQLAELSYVERIVECHFE